MYVIYPVLCVDIYVISLFVLMESKKPKKSIFPSLPSATLGKEGFAECRDHGTQQSWEAETQFPSFAECQSHGTRQRFFLKRKFFLPSARVWHSAKNFQKKKKKILCRVPLRWHSAKRPSELTSDFFLPSAEVTLGKGFTECPICGTRQRNLCRRVLCRLLFAECGTRQSLYRVYFGLCPVPQALGKLPVSSSASTCSYLCNHS